MLYQTAELIQISEEVKYENRKSKKLAALAFALAFLSVSDAGVNKI